MSSNFTSFVDYDADQKPQIAVSNHYSMAATSSNDTQKVIELLPNEIESFSCENVSFSMQFGESEQGKVVCTKVRLRFLPLVEKLRELPQRSKFFNDFYDVPLVAIAKIEVAVVKSTNKGKTDKFQRMEYNFSSMETISMIRLVLKDMRVVTIDIRRSQNGTHLANQILFFSKSGPIEKVVQVGAAMEERGRRAKIPYNGYDAWHAELQRCNQKTDSSSSWTICALHKEGFNYTAQGYPMYVVVSNYLARNDIERQLQHFKHGRFPIWVWSRAAGSASLMISGGHEQNLATPEILAKMTEAISRCHPNSDKPHVIKLEADFVSNVGKAYDHLLTFCAIDSYEQYVSREHNWHPKVARTGWLTLVRYCLTTTFEAVKWIVDRDRSVILQEESSGRDLALIVGSLTQICCDPFYRTTTGFQQLIDKMWIALGHPFGERLLGRDDDSGMLKGLKTPTRAATSASSSASRTNVAPTWLLFLDCVAQLLRIYTFEFTFSGHLLIALWDLSLTGMVPAMTCNNLDEQLVSQIGGGPFPTDRYFEKGYSKMFGNIWHDSVLFLESVKKNQPIYPSSKFLQCESIRPPTAPCEIVLWSDCYLRWILPANVKNGGALSEEEALDEKMIEMARRLGSGEWKRHLELPEDYSSAYPYSIAEISKPILELNDSDISDSVSLNFSMASFNQTPTTNTPNDFLDNSSSSSERRTQQRFGAESPVIFSMRPKEQIVGFTRYGFDEVPNARRHSGVTAETPILGQSPSTSFTPHRPPVRSNTVRSESRPVPPPRPSGLLFSPPPPQPILRVRIDQEDSSPTVTRF